MASKVIFTDSEIEKMTKLYKEGHGLTYIGKEFYVSAEAIRRTLKQNGVEMRHGTGATKVVITEDMIRKMITMYEIGTTIEKISKEIGISAYTVRNVLREKGVKMRLKKKQTPKELDSNELQHDWIDCNKNGRKCIYRANKTSPNLCDYILMTGHMRGCDPHRCTEYVENKK